MIKNSLLYFLAISLFLISCAAPKQSIIAQAEHPNITKLKKHSDFNFHFN